MAVRTETLGPGTFHLGDETTGLSIECQVREVTLNPDFDEGDDDQTLCGDAVSGEDTTTWKFEGELYQDWTSTGINKWSFDHNGQEVAFTWTPKTASGPSFAGTLKMRALPFGGKTREKLLAEFEWKVVGSPTPTWPA